jgi:hypothetical protein
VDQDAFEQTQGLRVNREEKSSSYTEFLVNAMSALQGLLAQDSAKSSSNGLTFVDMYTAD